MRRSALRSCFGHQYTDQKMTTGYAGVAGAAFMKKTFESWRSGGLAGHNMWHWALLLVDAGERQEALELFEGPILEYHGKNLAMGLQDIASLLYRLKLDDDPRDDATDIAEHWHTMADAIAGCVYDQGPCRSQLRPSSLRWHVCCCVCGRLDAACSAGQRCLRQQTSTLPWCLRLRDGTKRWTNKLQ